MVTIKVKEVISYKNIAFRFTKKVSEHTYFSFLDFILMEKCSNEGDLYILLPKVYQQSNQRLQKKKKDDV